MIKSIREFYTGISGVYETINSIITLGLDAHWRKKAVKMAVNNGPGTGRYLDMCSGTGQTAALLVRRLPPGARIAAVDFSLPMLERAFDHAVKQGFKNISFTLADAVDLPFRDNEFDVIIITFATRNLGAAPGHLLKSFREFHRVLKPGGCFLNLETSQPPLRIIKKLFHWYVRLTVMPVGRRISGTKGSYAYLSQSIRSFYPAKELAGILYEAGFETVTWKNLLFGAAALHLAKK